MMTIRMNNNCTVRNNFKYDIDIAVKLETKN